MRSELRAVALLAALCCCLSFAPSVMAVTAVKPSPKPSHTPPPRPTPKPTSTATPTPTLTPTPTSTPTPAASLSTDLYVGCTGDAGVEKIIKYASGSTSSSQATLFSDAFASHLWASPTTVWATWGRQEVDAIDATTGATSATISGFNTHLFSPVRVSTDTSGNIWVLDQGQTNGELPRVMEYPAGSNGDVTPIIEITGSNTLMQGGRVFGFAIDTSGNSYVSTTDGLLLQFPPGSNGDAAPTVLTDQATNAIDLAVDGQGFIYWDNNITSTPTTIFKFNIAARSINSSIQDTSQSAQGITIDNQGNLYVAYTSPRQVSVYPLTDFVSGTMQQPVVPALSIQTQNTGLDFTPVATCNAQDVAVPNPAAP